MVLAYSVSIGGPDAIEQRGVRRCAAAAHAGIESRQEISRKQTSSLNAIRI